MDNGVHKLLSVCNLSRYFVWPNPVTCISMALHKTSVGFHGVEIIPLSYMNRVRRTVVQLFHDVAKRCDTCAFSIAYCVWSNVDFLSGGSSDIH
jgi:hypothetical protein